MKSEASPLVLSEPVSGAGRKGSVTLLLIEDDPADAEFVREILSEDRHFNFDIVHAENLTTGLKRIAQGGIDVALVDLCLPDSGNVQTLSRIQSHTRSLPVIVLTGLDDEAVGVQAIRNGAQDYLIKGQVNLPLLSRSILYALERSRLSEALQQWIGSVSHEIRGSLTVIRGALDMLTDSRGGNLTRNQQEYVDMAMRHASFLDNYTNALLDLSRLGSGKAKLDFQPLNIGALVRQCMKTFEAESAGKAVAMELDCPAVIPTVNGDRDMILQVLGNLMSNALRFASTRIVVKIRPEAESSIENVRISIIDDGPGIAPEKMGLLFNKFVQLDRRRDSGGYKGTGLGLAICKEILELHHGKIWVDSRFGHGAEFHFQLAVYSESTRFQSIYQEAVTRAEMHQKPLVLMTLSVANAGEILDAYGGEGIETLLGILEDRGRMILRGTDIICRLKQQVIILLESRPEGIVLVRNRMLRKMTEPVAIKGWPGMSLACRIGVATYGDDAVDPEELVDIALKSATSDLPAA